MRAIIEYFDISMAIINSIILVLAAIILQAKTILMIIDLISIGVLCGLSIYTFSQNNPYYIISCYVLLVFGIIFTIGLLLIPELPFYSIVSILLIVILILNIFLGASLVKGSASSSARLARMSGVQVIIEPGITPTAIKDRNMGAPKGDLQEIENERNSMQKKYKARLIFLITVISSISYITTVFF